MTSHWDSRVYGTRFRNEFAKNIYIVDVAIGNRYQFRNDSA